MISALTRQTGRPARKAWRLRRLGWGAAVGVALVLLSELPRAQAWWDWWKYEGPSAVMSAGSAQDTAPQPDPAAASRWRQKVQQLPDTSQALLAWRALRQQHEAQGLQVEQWQADEVWPPTPAWPLAVHRAMLVAQGPATSWARLWSGMRQEPGLWRLEHLSVQPEQGRAQASRLRVQARWQTALRPAADARAEQASAPSAGPQGQMPWPATAQPEPLPAAMASAPSVDVSSPIPGGLHVSDWPLAQLRWVGGWHFEGRQEALFAVQGRLLRVAPGEAVGVEGYRWEGDVRGPRLTLRAPAHHHTSSGLPALVVLDLERMP